MSVPESKSFVESITPFFIFIIIAGISFYLGRDSMRNSYNPRAIKNNTDTFYYRDSAYAVKLNIDSVFEIGEYQNSK